jgi:hypothetical protein
MSDLQTDDDDDRPAYTKRKNRSVCIFTTVFHITGVGQFQRYGCDICSQNLKYKFSVNAFNTSHSVNNTDLTGQLKKGMVNLV